MQVVQLLGSTLGIAMLSGVNLYATVLTIGLGIRFDFIHLPAGLSGLSLLANPIILIVAGILYAVEFLVDKIPWLDSLWDAIHTIIRPIGAALLAAAAFSSVDPTLQMIAVLLGGGISLSAHSAKAGARLVANQSPEPVSNIVLSLGEDALAIGGSVFVINHPMAALVIVAVFLILFALAAPWLFRALNFEVAALNAMLRNLFHSDDDGCGICMVEDIPEKFRNHLPDLSPAADDTFLLACFSGKGIKGGRFRRGYLSRQKQMVTFLSKRIVGVRRQEIDLTRLKRVSFQRKFLFCRLIFATERKDIVVYFLKDNAGAAAKAAAMMQGDVGTVLPASLNLPEK